MTIAHSFHVGNQTIRPPRIWAERYQIATKKLIAMLREKGYTILTDVDGSSVRGIPNSIIVISDQDISACDIKDDFFVAAREIRIGHDLSLKVWEFKPGEIYAQEA